jgi:hypothetical protein
VCEPCVAQEEYGEAWKKTMRHGAVELASALLSHVACTGPVRLLPVADHREHLHRPVAMAVISFIAGQREVSEVRREKRNAERPLVIPNRRPETVRRPARAERADVGMDILANELPDVRVDV